MGTTTLAAPASSYLRRSTRILLGLGLFSIAATGVVTVAPAIAVQQGSGGQPSFEVIAATGVALIALAGLLLTYVGRRLGLGGAWLVLAVLSNAALLAYRFVVVPVSMYQTTFYLGWFSQDPNQREVLIAMAVGPVLAMGMILVAARYLAGNPRLSSVSVPRWHPSRVRAIAVAAAAALPLACVFALGSTFSSFFEVSTVTAAVGSFLPCMLAALWLLTTPMAFSAASWRAGDVGDVTVVTAFLWVALALLLIVHILWVVYMVALAHLLPFKTVVPTSSGK
jgi:hypothetical protein